MLKCFGHATVASEPKLIEEDDTVKVHFVLAFNEFRKSSTGKKKSTHFLPATAWSSGAETLYNTVRKGDGLTIMAQPRQHRWTDDDGNKKEKVFLRIEEFHVERKGEVEEDEQ